MIKESDRIAIIQEAKERFEISSSAEAENRAVYMHDKRFENGEQWTDEEKHERAGRPTITINKVAGSVKGILGDARQNRPRISVIPVDNNADPMIAEILQGIIRNIENNSDAEVAYDHGHADAVCGGFGYWRIIRDYESDDCMDQTLKIIRVPNPLAVYFDQESIKKDYSDASYCFICETMSRDRFKEQYPKASISDWDEGLGESDAAWFTDDSVRVAEYFYKEQYQKHIFLLSDGRVIEVRKPKRSRDEQGRMVVTGESTRIDPDMEKPYLIEEPIPYVKDRTVDAYKVMHCKMTGAEILDGPVEWPGKYIPVVPCLGEEVWIEGKRHLRSAFRHAIGAQKLYNWTQSNFVETLSMAKKSPVMVYDEQLGPYKEIWDRADKVPVSFLPLKYKDGLPYPQRLSGSLPDQGAVQGAAMANDDIKATIGRFDASLGNTSNEQTGIAIRERKMQGESSTFIFIDNQVQAIQYTGRILLDLIPRIWDTQRVVRLFGEDLGKSFEQNPMVQVAPNGASAWTAVNILDETGNIVAHDLSIGRYDIIMDAGPGFATRRQEATASMLEIIRIMPQMASLLAPKIAANSDWPEAQEIAQEMQQQQMQAMQQQQPDPMQQLMMAERQANVEKSQLQNQKMKMDMARGELDIAKKQMDLNSAGQRGQLDIQLKELALAKEVAELSAENQKLSPQAVYQIARKAIADTLSAVRK